ncbi:ABC transporter permease [candidate division KSB1 bacterium]
MKNRDPKPPRFTSWLLYRISPYEDRDSLIDDLEIEYRELAEHKSVLYAKFWYLIHLFKAIPDLFLSLIYWRFFMFRNYLKIALRNSKKNKGYSFVNIIGLSTGITCTLVIMLWINHETSYDRFHKKSDRIFRAIKVYPDLDGYSPQGPGPLAEVLKNRYPEIVNSARLFISDPRPTKYKNKTFQMLPCAAEASLLEIFDFPLIMGDPETAASGNNFIILTEEAARKLFGSEDPMYKSVTFDWWGRWLSYTVTGIFKNIPSNSHIKFDYIVPFSFVTVSGMRIDTWDVGAYKTYVLLDDNVDVEQFQPKISGILRENIPGNNQNLKLEPVTRIHLYNYLGGGPITYIYIFSAIAISILILACINFINLSTARSMTRAKEVGLRKVAGSTRTQLIGQFIVETVILTILSLAAALIIIFLFLPSIQNALGNDINFSFDTQFIIGLTGIMVFSGIISGLYPAFLLSAFQPVNVLKGFMKAGSGTHLFRKIMVIFQFTISVMFIICVSVIYMQLNLLKNKDIGLNKDYLLSLTINGQFYNKYPIINEELIKNPDIISLCRTNFSYSHGFGTKVLNWEGKEDNEEVSTDVRSADNDFLKTFSIKLKEGRFFSDDFPNDISESVVLNETAVKKWKIDSPVGKRFRIKMPLDREINGKIIGVVKDFNFRSLHSEIQPLVITKFPWWWFKTYIKIRSDNISETMTFMENKIKEIAPDFVFNYSFLTDDINKMYQFEKRSELLVRFGSFLAVIIAGLGLLGMSAFTAQNRIKEIGIRKILGASPGSIIKLLTKEFTKPLIIANILAWPLGYFLMDKWLQGYAYRYDINISVFLFAAFSAIVITVFSTGYQAIKAATADPVDSLRNE